MHKVATYIYSMCKNSAMCTLVYSAHTSPLLLPCSCYSRTETAHAQLLCTRIYHQAPTPRKQAREQARELRRKRVCLPCTPSRLEVDRESTVPQREAEAGLGRTWFDHVAHCRETRGAGGAYLFRRNGSSLNFMGQRACPQGQYIAQQR